MLLAIQELPDDAPIQDVMDRLLLVAKIETRVGQADAGQTMPRAAVKARMARRLG
jgi:hypothetical protein